MAPDIDGISGSVLTVLPRLAREAESGRPPRGPLDPVGRVHIPIGLPDTLDPLKTFVEAEGNFSPGFGTYGIYFWLCDDRGSGLVAPTMPGVACEHGLATDGLLIPWSEWRVGHVRVRTEVRQVRQATPAGEVFVVAARVHLVNHGPSLARASLVAALRPMGAAGGPVRRIAVADSGDGLLVDGHAALLAEERPSAAGVVETDTIGALVAQGHWPTARQAESAAGDGSGAMRFDLLIASGATRTMGLSAPSCSAAGPWATNGTAGARGRNWIWQRRTRRRATRRRPIRISLRRIPPGVYRSV